MEGDTNTVVFNAVPLDRYWQVRGGSYTGDLEEGSTDGVDFAWDGFNTYWHPEPQHGFEGTVELTYSTRVYFGEDGNGLQQTDYCSYDVSDDMSSVTFTEGCVLFTGTFNKVM